MNPPDDEESAPLSFLFVEDADFGHLRDAPEHGGEDGEEWRDDEHERRVEEAQ